MTNRVALVLATILGVALSVIRIAFASPIAWLSTDAGPLVPLEYPLLFGVVALWFGGLFGFAHWRVWLLIAAVATVIYIIVVTGALI